MEKKSFQFSPHLSFSDLAISSLTQELYWLHVRCRAATLGICMSAARRSTDGQLELRGRGVLAIITRGSSYKFVL